jgi:pyruvate dehydrogenase E1 component alpha subunit
MKERWAGDCQLGLEQYANVNSGLQEDDKAFQVHLSDESFETYELDPPSYTLDTTKKELKQMYYDMVSVR